MFRALETGCVSRSSYMKVAAEPRGTTLRDTGLPVVIVTHRGRMTGAIRKTPLMRVKEGDNYILVGSQGGAPKDPAWLHNLRADPHIELRDETIVRSMFVREVN